MNFSHIAAFLLRHFYITKRNPYRTFDIAVWPVLQLLLWGFVTFWIQSIAQRSMQLELLYAVMTALLFWEVFVRLQQGFSVTFLEERWSHNVANLFVAPLALRDFVGGMLAVGLIKAMLGMAMLTFLSWVLYALDVFRLGFLFIPFLLNLFLFGLALGVVSVALVIRFGSSVEVLAWAVSAVLQPLSAVFYPVSVLPEFLQYAVFLLPTTHIFEGMREALRAETLPVNAIFFAFVLNCVYLVGAFMFLGRMFRIARRDGLLLRLSTQ